MINFLTNLRALPLLTGIFLLGYGCSETPQIYTHPEWLGGTNIETLEKEGDCNIFLELMEKADYKEPIEKQLFTLFVPRDSAFEVYFNAKGVESVDDLSEEEAFRLFTMYVLPNPLSRYQLIYEYAWDLESPDGEYGALFFRKKTRSKMPSYKETPLYHPIYAGEELTIQTDKSIYIPFFTTDYMEDYFATSDGSDYEFLCRDSDWSGTQWHDAMVTDAEVRTATGFIYFLDRVVEQPLTVDKYLRDNPDKYSVFYGMIQPFAGYAQWVNDNDELVYEKRYNTKKIYDIANPMGPSTWGGPHTMREMFTLFMPSNEAWLEYFDRNGIEDFENLSEISRIYLIQSHIIRQLAFKSKLDRGMGSTFGDIIDIDTENDISDSYLCNNAAVYDLNRVLEPFIFKTVTGPVFLDEDYSTFLLSLYLADKMNMVSSRDFDVTVFTVTNQQFQDIGIRYNDADDEMQFYTNQEKWVEFDDDDFERFVDGFIVKDKLTDLSGEGFVELVSGEYFYFNDDRLYGAGNIEDGDYAAITSRLENEVNGMLYYLETPLKASHYTTAQRLMNDPDLSDFFNLMKSASMVSVYEDPLTFDEIHRFVFLQGKNDWTIFAPTNDAMAEARDKGLIPSNQGEIQAFIYNHIIQKNVLFDDGEVSGVFNTNYQVDIGEEGPIFTQLQVNNSSHNMVITDPSGQEIIVPHTTANNLVRGGVYHKIPSVIKLP